MPVHTGQSSPQLSTINTSTTAVCTSVHLLLIAVLHVGRDVLEKGNVLVCVELCHLLPCRRLGNLPKSVSYHSTERSGGPYAHVEFPVDVVVDDEVVHHAHAVRLHRVLALAYCAQRIAHGGGSPAYW